MRGGEGERSRLGPLFAAKSWGYSAFQYILPCQAPETNRCASRFATTASARRASAAPQGPKPGGRALKLRNLPEIFGRHTGSVASESHGGGSKPALPLGQLAPRSWQGHERAQLHPKHQPGRDQRDGRVTEELRTRPGRGCTGTPVGIYTRSVP